MLHDQIWELYNDMISGSTIGPGTRVTEKADDMEVTTETSSNSGSDGGFNAKWQKLKWLYGEYEANGCDMDLLPVMPAEPIATPKYQRGILAGFGR